MQRGALKASQFTEKQAADTLTRLGFTVIKLDGSPDARHTMGCGCVMDGRGKNVTRCEKCTTWFELKAVVKAAKKRGVKPGLLREYINILTQEERR